MTVVPLPTSADEGVTKRRARSAAAARPGNTARAQRYDPPTAGEVGRAAALCFQDTLTDEQIARQLGIVRRTLARWKRRTDFAAAMAALHAWQELASETSAAGEASRRPDPRQVAEPDGTLKTADAAYPWKPVTSQLRIWRRVGAFWDWEEGSTGYDVSAGRSPQAMYGAPLLAPEGRRSPHPD